MPWLSSRPPGRSRRGQRRGVLVDAVGADVLDHADAGDRVVGLGGQLPVIHDPDLDAVGHARLLGAPARELRLRLRQRDAGDRHPVLAGDVDREAAPAAADVEHAFPRAELELRGRELELGPLRRLEARAVAREERAAVGHRRVEEEREEVVGDVVVVADRPPVALGAVAAAARAQLGLRDRWRPHRADGPRGGDRQAQLRRRGRSAVGASRRAARARSSRSSTSSSPLTYARPRPSWPGARSAWASAAGERTCSVGARPPLVGGSSVPSQNVSRKGRSGTAASSSRRSGPVVRRAATAYVLTALRSWRSGGMRTTSQARPVFSSAQITHAEMSTCQRRMP